MLCISGPCKYIIKRESGVSDAFVLQYVVPNLKNRFDDDVALIFSTTLLYYVYVDDQNQVPDVIKQRVRDTMIGFSQTPN